MPRRRKFVEAKVITKTPEQVHFANIDSIFKENMESVDTCAALKEYFAANPSAVNAVSLKDVPIIIHAINSIGDHQILKVIVKTLLETKGEGYFTTRIEGGSKLYLLTAELARKNAMGIYEEAREEMLQEREQIAAAKAELDAVITANKVAYEKWQKHVEARMLRAEELEAAEKTELEAVIAANKAAYDKWQEHIEAREMHAKGLERIETLASMESMLREIKNDAHTVNKERASLLDKIVVMEATKRSEALEDQRVDALIAEEEKLREAAYEAARQASLKREELEEARSKADESKTIASVLERNKEWQASPYREIAELFKESGEDLEDADGALWSENGAKRAKIISDVGLLDIEDLGELFDKGEEDMPGKWRKILEHVKTKFGDRQADKLKEIYSKHASGDAAGSADSGAPESSPREVSSVDGERGSEADLDAVAEVTAVVEVVDLSPPITPEVTEVEEKVEEKCSDYKLDEAIEGAAQKATKYIKETLFNDTVKRLKGGTQKYDDNIKALYEIIFREISNNIEDKSLFIEFLGNDKLVSDMLGQKISGWVSSSYTGHLEAFYNKSSYSTTGKLSGALSLAKIIDNDELKEELIESIIKKYYAFVEDAVLGGYLEKVEGNDEDGGERVFIEADKVDYAKLARDTAVLDASVIRLKILENLPLLATRFLVKEDEAPELESSEWAKLEALLSEFPLEPRPKKEDFSLNNAGDLMMKVYSLSRDDGASGSQPDTTGGADSSAVISQVFSIPVTMSSAAVWPPLGWHNGSGKAIIGANSDADSDTGSEV